MTGSEVPDVFCAVFEYPNLMATWTLNYCNSYDNDWAIQFQGDQGTMIINNAGYRIWKEPWLKNPRARTGDGGAGADRAAHPELPGLREVAAAAERAGGSGRQRSSAPHLANVAFHGDRRAHLSADGSKVS